MNSDLKSVTSSATGAVTAQRARLKAVYFVSGGTAGTITFRNADGSGTVMLTIATPASATHTDSIHIPDNGILFPTAIHVTISNAFSVTSIFDGAV